MVLVDKEIVRLLTKHAVFLATFFWEMLAVLSNDGVACAVAAARGAFNAGSSHGPIIPMRPFPCDLSHAIYAVNLPELA
jgi:hypothetical protein